MQCACLPNTVTRYDYANIFTSPFKPDGFNEPLYDTNARDDYWDRDMKAAPQGRRLIIEKEHNDFICNHHINTLSTYDTYAL